MSDSAIEQLAHLAERARQGGDAAVEQLVHAAAPLVRRWALVQVGNAADADDVMEEVLIRMIRHLDSLTDNAAFPAWLYAATKNAAVDHLRSRTRRERRTLALDAIAELPTEALGPEAAAEQRQLGHVLATSFHDLPQRQRQIFDLVELQGLSASVAAQLLGIKPTSVRGNLFKARRRLRKRLLAQWPNIQEDWL